MTIKEKLKSTRASLPERKKRPCTHKNNISRYIKSIKIYKSRYNT